MSQFLLTSLVYESLAFKIDTWKQILCSHYCLLSVLVFSYITHLVIPVILINFAWYSLPLERFYLLKVKEVNEETALDHINHVINWDHSYWAFNSVRADAFLSHLTLWGYWVSTTEFQPWPNILLRLSSMMNPEFYFLFFQFCETSQNLCLLAFRNQQ